MCGSEWTEFAVRARATQWLNCWANSPLVGRPTGFRAVDAAAAAAACGSQMRAASL